MFVLKLFSLPLFLVAMITALVGCDDKTTEEAEVPAPQVVIQVVQPQVLSINETLPGRVNALHTAEIRPQVSGIIQRRLFEQGAEIKKGTPLFQINAAPFEAEVASAQAGLLRARAANDKAQQQAARLRPLMKTGAVSRQSFDDAISNARQAAADVAQACAALRRKELDLRFATVEAPIAGRIDQALVSEGAYVTASDSTPLARIYQTDPIYVDVHQPAEVYHQLRQQAASQQETAADLPVKVLLPGGALYNHPGRILFSGISVDTATGDVMVRIAVNNPERELLPGMFVRVEIPRQHYKDALMVPQQAISRQEGHPVLWVVDDHQHAHPINVHVAELTHGAYRIAEGLSAGSHVVVQGMDKLTNGMSVTAATSTASPASLTMKAGE